MAESEGSLGQESNGTKETGSDGALELQSSFGRSLISACGGSSDISSEAPGQYVLAPLSLLWSVDRVGGKEGSKGRRRTLTEAASTHLRVSLPTSTTQTLAPATAAATADQEVWLTLDHGQWWYCGVNRAYRGLFLGAAARCKPTNICDMSSDALELLCDELHGGFGPVDQ
ncbi:uncharacterized protein PSFLO_02807 [Pseudozyma flocculosa]|uniref:Uncharacterized protein n=1 Tax=Pseudozyma flocculosa TaxID=84751 RepID=A0A5C3EYK3_9BASI|nr:uncharacterized protein PSFLO_02807 [Pseudozyma flocculosa]